MSNKKENLKFEQARSRSARRSAKLSGALGFIAIIAIVLYYGISTYLPYANHKSLLTVKNTMLKIATAENQYYQENKKFASVEELLHSSQTSLNYENYMINVDIKPDLSTYVITAQQLDSAKTQYPNCHKLVVTPRKYFSYDTYGEPSTGCW